MVKSNMNWYEAVYNLYPLSMNIYTLYYKKLKCLSIKYSLLEYVCVKYSKCFKMYICRVYV